MIILTIIPLTRKIDLGNSKWVTHVNTNDKTTKKMCMEYILKKQTKKTTKLSKHKTLIHNDFSN